VSGPKKKEAAADEPTLHLFHHECSKLRLRSFMLSCLSPLRRFETIAWSADAVKKSAH